MPASHHPRPTSGRSPATPGTSERGATLVEYVMLAGLLAIVCVMAGAILSTASS